MWFSNNVQFLGGVRMDFQSGKKLDLMHFRVVQCTSVFKDYSCFDIHNWQNSILNFFVCWLLILYSFSHMFFYRCEWHSAKMWRLSKILVICLFIQSSHAYSLGAPDAACKRMTPGMQIFDIRALLKFTIWGLQMHQVKGWHQVCKF